jgi:hypothetical protein
MKLFFLFFEDLVILYFSSLYLEVVLFKAFSSPCKPEPIVGADVGTDGEALLATVAGAETVLGTTTGTGGVATTGST